MALMMPHDSGIHVDIRKKPVVYTPLSLSRHQNRRSQFGDAAGHSAAFD